MHDEGKLFAFIWLRRHQFGVMRSTYVNKLETFTYYIRHRSFITIVTPFFY